MSNNYWRTPAPVLVPIAAMDPNHGITLDPFGTRAGTKSYVHATRQFTEDRRKRNGGGAFEGDWLRASMVAPGVPGLSYVNNPYGPGMMGPCADLTRYWGDQGARIVTLWPSSTDVVWFQEAFDSADQLCLWKGRIQFVDTRVPGERKNKKRKNSPLFSSAVFHWAGLPDSPGYGERLIRFQQIFSAHGKVVPCGRHRLTLGDTYADLPSIAALGGRCAGFQDKAAPSGSARVGNGPVALSSKGGGLAFRVDPERPHLGRVNF